eukprot:403340989
MNISFIIDKVDKLLELLLTMLPLTETSPLNVKIFKSPTSLVKAVQTCMSVSITKLELSFVEFATRLYYLLKLPSIESITTNVVQERSSIKTNISEASGVYFMPTTCQQLSITFLNLNSPVLSREKNITEESNQVAAGAIEVSNVCPPTAMFLFISKSIAVNQTSLTVPPTSLGKLPAKQYCWQQG